MGRWLKEKPRGIYRVLHSAAAIRRRRIMVGEKREQYRTAYAYLRKRIACWIIVATVGITCRSAAG